MTRVNREKSRMDTAEDAVRAHGEAINGRDVVSYLATTNFPFTYQNYDGVALTVEGKEEYAGDSRLPWEIILQGNSNWHHTRFDGVDEVARSISSVVFKIMLSRIDHSGHDYGTYQAIWIVTNQNGHWGVQFRHNLGLVAEAPSE